MTMSLRRHYKNWSKCHGNERLKRKAFRRLRKTDIEGADVTCWGRLFQVRAAATGKARSPTVDSRVRRTFNVNDDEERRRLRVPKSAAFSNYSSTQTAARKLHIKARRKKRQKHKCIDMKAQKLQMLKQQSTAENSVSNPVR